MELVPYDKKTAEINAYRIAIAVNNFQREMLSPYIERFLSMPTTSTALVSRREPLLPADITKAELQQPVATFFQQTIIPLHRAQNPEKNLAAIVFFLRNMMESKYKIDASQMEIPTELIEKVAEVFALPLPESYETTIEKKQPRLTSKFQPSRPVLLPPSPIIPSTPTPSSILPSISREIEQKQASSQFDILNMFLPEDCFACLDELGREIVDPQFRVNIRARDPSDSRKVIEDCFDVRSEIARREIENRYRNLDDIPQWKQLKNYQATRNRLARSLEQTQGLYALKKDLQRKKYLESALPFSLNEFSSETCPLVDEIKVPENAVRVRIWDDRLKKWRLKCYDVENLSQQLLQQDIRERETGEDFSPEEIKKITNQRQFIQKTTSSTQRQQALKELGQTLTTARRDEARRLQEEQELASEALAAQLQAQYDRERAQEPKRQRTEVFSPPFTPPSPSTPVVETKERKSSSNYVPDFSALDRAYAAASHSTSSSFYTSSSSSTSSPFTSTYSSSSSSSRIAPKRPTSTKRKIIDIESERQEKEEQE